ncbi:MAG: hypothetical protein KatS3mg008_1958 [Acidimicrobiales bacterium]|nr:MAG: hypothetical protein KatS3mg008_1958 [Acidimicrobiales bacterium]
MTFRVGRHGTILGVMGQPVTVVEKRSSVDPRVVRFETNRPLSGMSHERFRSVDEAVGDRPVDELARRLFATGCVEYVHVQGNVVTVHVREGADTSSLRKVVEDLFIFYRDGVRPEAPA